MTKDATPWMENHPFLWWLGLGWGGGDQDEEMSMRKRAMCMRGHYV